MTKLTLPLKSGGMPDLKEVLLQGISKKLDQLIELIRELIKTLGNKINKDGY